MRTQSKPLTKEEMDEGDAEEFRKMDKYETYGPVEQKDGVKILDAVSGPASLTAR